MKISDELIYRGLIKDKTFSDPAWLDTPKTFYLGVDCNSADSMTIGNLAIFLVARRLLDAGWGTVLLVGGATSLIGDPGGKNEERELKSREEILKNVAGISAQVSRLFDGKNYTLVDNYDWFKDIGYLEFLRDVGKHYSMTELVQRDFIADRMGEGGSGISYAEFSYTLVQGYDYWHLYKNHGVVLQIGGSDQWGNMLSGVPLIRKKEGAEAHAFSMPLVIDKTTGKKFGKSEAGAIWLDAEKTSPYAFYQFWLNASDEQVEDFLKIYTLLSKEEIDQLMLGHNQNRAERIAQKKLANEVTSLVHGTAATSQAEWATKIVTGETSTDLIDEAMAKTIRRELPYLEVLPGDDMLELLTRTGLVASKSEARRLLQGGGVYLNHQSYAAPTLSVLTKGSYALLRKGKAFKDSALLFVR